jgi:hypothetical protein
MHGNMRDGDGGSRHARHHCTAWGTAASTLCGSDCGKNHERSCKDQEAAHHEYLGSRAAGPFLHVHL